MAVADLFFLAVVIISAVIGLFRGLVREALSLAAWILAFVIALRFGPQAAEYLTPYVSVPSVRLATAYSVLFLATLILGAIINFFLGKMVRATGFSGTDRTLGLCFGVARGIAILVIAIMLARLTVVRDDPWWKDSVFILYLEPWAEQLQGWIPENLDDQIEQLQKPGTPGDDSGQQSSPSSS